MKERILEILQRKGEFHDNNETFFRLSAEEISDHVMEFIEWLIHNTMEATTYSPMLYLRKGITVFYQKEYHLEDIYQYWLDNIKK